MKQRKTEKTKSARRRKFEQGVRQGKPPYRSALDAGYSAHTAKNSASKMAAPVRLEMAEALRAEGLDERSQAAKLKKLREAETVRWNPKKNRWDKFGDADVQMRATQEISRLLDAYPAPKEKVEDSRPITIVLGSLRELRAKT